MKLDHVWNPDYTVFRDDRHKTTQQTIAIVRTRYENAPNIYSVVFCRPELAGFQRKFSDWLTVCVYIQAMSYELLTAGGANVE